MPIEVTIDESTKLLSGEEHTTGATAWSVFLNLTMTAIGAGCMALPYTLAASGFILGPLLLVVCALVSGTSLVGLAHLADRTGKTDYSDIAQALLGDVGRVLTTVGLFMLLVGAGAVFLDISTDLLYPFAQPAFASKLATRVCIAGLMAIFSIPRTMHALRYMSFIGMSCLCYILLGILYHTVENKGTVNTDDGPAVQAFKPGLGVVLALNLQSMAFMCHPSLPILYGELKGENRSLMPRIIQSSVFFVFAFYLIMAVSHYYVQNGHPSGNLLSDYKPGDSMMSIAKCILSLVLILKAPLVYRPLNSLFYATFQLQPASPFTAVLECVSMYVGLVFLTLLIPDLVTLMSWVGLTCGALIGFILPGSMLFVDAGKADEGDDSFPSWTRGTLGRLIGFGIASYGVFLSVFGPFTINYSAS